MLIRHKFAGLLTAFGAVGLALSPMMDTSSRHQTTPAVEVAIAVTLGPQLNLTRIGDRRNHSPAIGGRSMLCGDVYRMQIADIGLNCRSIPKPQDVALAKSH